jgi:hypothetical protein
MDRSRRQKWMKRGGLLLVLMGAGCLVLALVAVIAQRPLQGMVLPPYGATLLPPDEAGPLTGWQLDAAVALVVGLSGVIGGLMLWGTAR